MNVDLKSRVINSKFITVEFEDKRFKLKKLDQYQVEKIIERAHGLGEQHNLNKFFVIDSVVAYFGIKLKDIVDGPEGFTAEELDSEVEFDKDYLEMFFGKNRDALIKIAEAVATELTRYTKNLAEEKKS